MKRYEVLDSWRGIAACMVALFHFPAHSHIYNLGLVRHAFLFVDLFFVLSGFVIAANYHARLLGGFGVGKFMWLRLGRLYPLHVAVLVALLSYRGIELAIPALGAMAGHRPFNGPDESLGTIIANLTLTQGLHLFGFLTWDEPSWSISDEFFTYFLFAGAVVMLGARIWPMLGVAAIVSSIALWALNGNIWATYDYGLFRSIYGFAIGALAWRIASRFDAYLRGTGLELAVLAGVLTFVSLTGYESTSLLAPIVFAVLVMVFAAQTGAVSKVLMHPSFVLLGTLSYSIYMLHWVIGWRIISSAKHFATGEIVNEHFGSTLWQGDAGYVAYLALVIGVAWITFKVIEAPSRAWFRGRVSESHNGATLLG